MNKAPIESESHERRQPGFRWSAGILCCSGLGLSCLESVVRAAPDEVRLFVDPKVCVPNYAEPIAVTSVDRTLGKTANFLLAVAELLMRTPEADASLILHSEFGLLPAFGSAVEGLVRAAGDKSLLILYSAGSNRGVRTDFTDLPAIIIPRPVAKRLLSHPTFFEHAGSEGCRQTGVEDALKAWADDAEITLDVPDECLVCHVAESADEFSPPAGDIPVSEPRIRLTEESSISVIVPTWNCGPWLRQCLHTLMNQSVHAEIVVVDDASDDDTWRILESYGDALTVIRHSKRAGANAARNTGLRATKTELVVFADADNEYAPQWLQKLVDAVRSEPNVGVAYCGYTKVFENGSRVATQAKPWSLHELWYGNFIDMPSVVRRTAIPEHGLHEGFQPFDDWRLWLDMASCGWKGKWVPECLFEKWMRIDGKTRKSMSDPGRRAGEVAGIRRQYAGLVNLEHPIAVVIPACEAPDLTRKCLTHLSEFAGVPFFVCYVDNGSPAGTLETVAEHAEQIDCDLRIIRNSRNAGFTRAVNQGIRASTHCHVLVLNNDCFVGPGCVESLAWAIVKGERIAAAGPLTGDAGRQSLKNNERLSQSRARETILAHLDDPVAATARLRKTRRMRDEEVLAFFCALLNREAIDRCGELDERFASGLAADDEWCLRVRRRGWQVQLALHAYATHLHQETFDQLGIDRDALQRDAKQMLPRVLGE